MDWSCPGKRHPVWRPETRNGRRWYIILCWRIYQHIYIQDTKNYIKNFGIISFILLQPLCGKGSISVLWK